MVDEVPKQNSPVSKRLDLRRGFDSIKSEKIAYLHPYTFEAPIVMSLETATELKQLGLVLYKAIDHMIGNYLRYLHIIPRDEMELQLLEMLGKYSCRPGVFRTDFVIDEQSQIKIIEINSRQCMNGLFTSGFFHEIALRQAKQLKITGISDMYSGLFEYLEQMIGDRRHVCALYGDKIPDEIKIFPLLFANSGIPCHTLHVRDLPKNLRLLENAWVIKQFSVKELFRLPIEVIEVFANSNPQNAIQASHHSGNKKFFYALNHPEFIGNSLEPEERELLKKYLVPTYINGNNSDMWEDAYKNKDGYIMKNETGGRSEEVYAGRLTDERGWKDLFESVTLNQMVLQPFIQQKKIEGTIGTERRNDYVTGTLLYFNREFFGPGMYRTHTSPVTRGVGDFRKIAQLVAEVKAPHPGIYYL